MSEFHHGKRPAPDAYDHLWTLLPVFVSFFAALVYIAATDNRPLPGDATIDSRPAATPAAAQTPWQSLDRSAPQAVNALAAQPEGVSEHIASF